MNESKININVLLKSIIIYVLVIILSGCSLFDWKQKAKENLECNELELLEVIELVKSNKLEHDSNLLYKVPDKYKKLTKDGVVVVYQNNKDGIQVGFYSFRGMQTGSCQLMYSSGGEDMIKENETGHKIKEIDHFKDNWYYVETDY